MSEMIKLDAIDPGMLVLDINGEELGPVESIHPASIRVADREIPREAIATVNARGVYLRIAKMALLAHRDPAAEGLTSTAAAFTMPENDTKHSY